MKHAISHSALVPVGASCDSRVPHHHRWPLCRRGARAKCHYLGRTPCRGAYAKGHIAGAVNIGDAAKVLRDENTEDFIAIDRVEKILGAAGLDPNREIIVYGSRGTWNPYFGLYALQYFGGRNVRSIMKASRTGPPLAGRSAAGRRSFRPSRSSWKSIQQ